MKKLAATLFERVVDEIKRQCCPNCIQWNKEKEICILYNQRPPAEVIVRGCPSFEEDEIPF